MSEATLTSLLEYLYTALTPSNQRWVAEHLMEHAEAEELEIAPAYALDKAECRRQALKRDTTPEQLYKLISEEIDDIYAND